MTTENVANIRVNYSPDGALDEEKLPPAPMPLFKSWMQEAIDFSVHEPNAMCLSTASLSGQPSSRFVLLKGLDEEGVGFLFFTNLKSRKARELMENPKCALTFWWGGLEKSIRIEGAAERVTEEEECRYFDSRPWGSRVGAWVSKQSEVIEGREVLEKRNEEMKSRFGDAKGDSENGTGCEALTKPPFWGGFKVKAQKIEFWKGRESRLHDRIVYERQKGNDDQKSWAMMRLQP